MGLAQGKGGDVCVERGCMLCCWDMIGVMVGIIKLLESWLHQPVWHSETWKWVTHIEGRLKALQPEQERHQMLMQA